jgi:3-hydroxybutyryl-CoA dehydrogenase
MTDKEKIKIAIVGSGNIGKQLAIFFALKNHEVILVSHNERSMEKARNSIKEKMSKVAGQITFMDNISFSCDIEDLKNAKLVFEAVNEDLQIKKKVLKSIDSTVSRAAIIGSNTSSISINELANDLTGKDRFLGIHFFNPVAKMKLVEIISSSHTSTIVLQIVQEFMTANEKTPISIGDSPAFIVNRVLMPLINEASYLIQEGNDPKTVDSAIKLGLNHPMGPLELADLIGIDICVQIMENIAAQTGEEKYLPSNLLKQMVDQGTLGRKTGKGFYSYL